MKLLISLFYRKHFRCFITGIVLGILIGIVAFSILVSFRMDKSYREIKRLELINEDKDLRLRKLEESVDKTRLILKSIEIFLIYEGYEGDEIDKIELERIIKEKYNLLLGKEVGGIDIDLVAEVVDKRIVKLEEKEYKLKLQKLILGEVLKIWVEVSLID